MKKKMIDFERESSKFSSLLTLSLFAILLFAVLPVLLESDETSTSSHENTIAMDLVIFQEPVSLPSPEEEVTEREVVELTEPKETVIAPDELTEELIDSSADGLPDYADPDSTAYFSEESAIHDTNSPPTVADKDIIVSQLVSLIEQKKEYSTRAQQRGIEGTVLVEVTLSEECVVTDFIIVESESSLLDNSVEDTMNRIIGIDVSGERLQEPLIVAVPIEFILI